LDEGNSRTKYKEITIKDAKTRAPCKKTKLKGDLKPE